MSKSKAKGEPRTKPCVSTGCSVSFVAFDNHDLCYACRSCPATKLISNSSVRCRVCSLWTAEQWIKFTRRRKKRDAQRKMPSRKSKEKDGKTGKKRALSSSSSDSSPDIEEFYSGDEGRRPRTPHRELRRQQSTRSPGRDRRRQSPDSVISTPPHALVLYGGDESSANDGDGDNMYDPSQPSKDDRRTIPPSQLTPKTTAITINPTPLVDRPISRLLTTQADNYPNLPGPSANQSRETPQNNQLAVVTEQIPVISNLDQMLQVLQQQQSKQLDAIHQNLQQMFVQSGPRFTATTTSTSTTTTTSTPGFSSSAAATTVSFASSTRSTPTITPSAHVQFREPTVDHDRHHGGSDDHHRRPEAAEDLPRKKAKKTKKSKKQKSSDEDDRRPTSVDSRRHTSDRSPDFSSGSHRSRSHDRETTSRSERRPQTADRDRRASVSTSSTDRRSPQTADRDRRPPVSTSSPDRRPPQTEDRRPPQTPADRRPTSSGQRTTAATDTMRPPTTSAGSTAYDRPQQGGSRRSEDTDRRPISQDQDSQPYGPQPPPHDGSGPDSLFIADPRFDHREADEIDESTIIRFIRNNTYTVDDIMDYYQCKEERIPYLSNLKTDIRPKMVRVEEAVLDFSNCSDQLWPSVLKRFKAFVQGGFLCDDDESDSQSHSPHRKSVYSRSPSPMSDADSQLQEDLSESPATSDSKMLKDSIGILQRWDDNLRTVGATDADSKRTKPRVDKPHTHSRLSESPEHPPEPGAKACLPAHTRVKNWYEFTHEFINRDNKANKPGSAVHLEISKKAAKLFSTGSRSKHITQERVTPERFDKISNLSDETKVQKVRSQPLSLSAPVTRVTEAIIRSGISTQSYEMQLVTALQVKMDNVMDRINSVKSFARDKHTRHKESLKHVEEATTSLARTLRDIRKVLDTTYMAADANLAAWVSLDYNLTLAQRDRLTAKLLGHMKFAAVGLRKSSLQSPDIFPDIEEVFRSSDKELSNKSQMAVWDFVAAQTKKDKYKDKKSYKPSSKPKSFVPRGGRGRGNAGGGGRGRGSFRNDNTNFGNSGGGRGRGRGRPQTPSRPFNNDKSKSK
jgi:hypothetical protein